MVHVDFFLSINTGAPWKIFQNIYLNADITTDASGRSYAGVIDFPNGPFEVVGGEFEDTLLEEDTVYGKIPATLPATYDTHPSGAYYSLIFVGKFTILFFFAAFFQIPENGGAYYSVFAYRSVFAYHSTTAYCSTTFNKLNLQYLSI